MPAWNFEPSYNICPTDQVPVVIPATRGRQLVLMCWGLVPNWWSKPLKDMRMLTFNARAETLAEKPFFRDGFKRSRCLMRASGYYEWLHSPEGKQPYYFNRRDGSRSRSQDSSILGAIAPRA